jgi:hypothetical protein
MPRTCQEPAKNLPRTCQELAKNLCRNTNARNDTRERKLALTKMTPAATKRQAKNSRGGGVHAAWRIWELCMGMGYVVPAEVPAERDTRGTLAYLN